ncbi:hypothetical protein [uncultured Jatrophihabitans sp.]|uniref:hypothetical protein n=1 Tax=uncultured Jatrophihabitans sp. TaxID=1610747 RepID=UPI0035CB1F1A
MSKARQTARAEREAAATARAAADRAAAARRSTAAARRERRALLWRRLRLWQHHPGTRQRERFGVLGILVLVVLLTVFVVTRSWSATLGAALVCVIAAPVYLVLNRSQS